MDVNNLGALQFNAYPGGSHFLISNINVEYSDTPVPLPVKKEEKKKSAMDVSRIEKIQMPAPGSAAERTFAGSQITLKDNVFYRNGAPAFVLGGCHSVDLARFLLGSDIAAVRGDSVQVGDWYDYPPV